MQTRIIALSRQVGTGGEDVAQGVAAKLGHRYIDYQIVQDAAHEAGVSSETVGDAQHTPSLMTRILEGLARSPSIPSGGWSDPGTLQTSPLVTSADYRSIIETVIRDIGEQGESVILGHGAAIILADRRDVLRVLITGTAKPRAKRLTESMAIDERAALKVVERTDRERVDYFRRFYNCEWLSPSVYDLCLNSDKLSTDEMVGIICHAVGVG